MHVPDKSVEPAAFSYSNARGARIVERRRSQSSHWSTKTARLPGEGPVGAVNVTKTLPQCRTLHPPKTRSKNAPVALLAPPAAMPGMLLREATVSAHGTESELRDRKFSESNLRRSPCVIAHIVPTALPPM